MITRLDQEIADRDISSEITVLTDTPSATQARLCQALVKLGDGSKDLDGTGGDFLINISIGGQNWDGGQITKTLGTDVRAIILTDQFLVPANDEVVITVESPNAGDSDVGVTAELYAVDDVNIKSIDDDEDAAQKLARSTDTMVIGTVDDSVFTPTTTAFESNDVTEATADHYNGRFIVFITGNLRGQATDITDYELSGSNGKFTVTGLTEAPSDGDTFIIV